MEFEIFKKYHNIGINAPKKHHRLAMLFVPQYTYMLNT